MRTFLIITILIVLAIVLVTVYLTLRDRSSRRSLPADAAEQQARIASDAGHGEGAGSAMTANFNRSSGSA